MPFLDWKDPGFLKRSWIEVPRWLRKLGRRPSNDLPVAFCDSSNRGSVDRSNFAFATSKAIRCSAPLRPLDSNSVLDTHACIQSPGACLEFKPSCEPAFEHHTDSGTVIRVDLACNAEADSASNRAGRNA